MKFRPNLFILIIVLSAMASTPVWSQDDEDNSEELLELVEPTEEAASSNKSSSGSDETGKTGAVRLNDDEKQGLVDARKSKSEATMLRVTSEILSRDHQNVHALNALALFYFDAKKYGLAKMILKRAIKDHPNEPALQNNLGVVYLAENDLLLAIDAFKKSLELKSNYEVGAVNLSSVFLEYKDYQRGLRALEEAFRERKSDLRRGSPEAVEIANNYAVALMGIDEKDKAGEVFEDIYDSTSRNPLPVMNYLLFLVEVEKNKKSAMKVASKLKLMTEDQELKKRADELVGRLE